MVLKAYIACSNPFPCSKVISIFTSLTIDCFIFLQGPAGGRYECHICGNRYSRGTGLTKHLKKQHTFRWPAGHNRFRYSFLLQ